MKRFVIALIDLYQKKLSRPLKMLLEFFGLIKSNSCVFYPSCSEYSKQAFNKYGPLKGFFLSLLRIFRCHPWQKDHIDPLK